MTFRRSFAPPFLCPDFVECKKVFVNVPSISDKQGVEIGVNSPGPNMETDADNVSKVHCGGGSSVSPITEDIIDNFTLNS